MFYRNLYRELEVWKSSPTRKPLVIRGARQVGKTTLVNEFGKQFKQYIYLNLEKMNDAKLFDQFQDIQQLISRVFLEKRAQINALSDTLLFIDEIQERPEVVNLLRYFKEDLPELAVIAAGSMLETLLGKNLTFPVGRVEYKVLRPVSFDEYLKALGEDALLEELNKIPIEKYAEQALFDAFRTYALLGGMPEIIQHYKENKDVTALAPIYDALINSYLQDAEKYAKNEAQLHLIRFSIQQAMLRAGQRTNFQQFGNSNYTSKAIAEVLRALEKTHLLQLIYPTTSAILPVEPDIQKTPRLQFFDSGLVNYHVGLQKDILGTTDLSSVYQGTLIEHLVGQELLSFQTLSLNKLHFWVRYKKQSDAELDFVFPYQGKLIPIEVKSGAKGTLKSLQVFMEQSPLHFAIRFYGGSRQIDELTTPNGKQFYLISLPFFLASKITHYIDWINASLTARFDSEVSLVQESNISYQRQKRERTWFEEDLSDKHLKILKACFLSPHAGRDLIELVLGLSYQSINKRKYISPLLSLGFIDYSITNNKKSKNQRYFITAKGIDFLQNFSK